MKTILISTLALTLGLGAGLPVAAHTGLPQVTAVGAGDSLILPLDLARRGADDAPGDDRRGRGRGADDGPNHASAGAGDEGVIQMARRGRGGDDAPGDDHGGRGRGGDDAAGDDRGGSRDDAGGSGRSKPRIPGGSGCDDAGDILEHPECS